MNQPAWRTNPAPTHGRCAVYRDDRYVCEPYADDAHRIVACLNACEGIPTEQLNAMNALRPGLLAEAYDVCSSLWESFGEDLINDEPIAGSEAVEALCAVGSIVDLVVRWARKPDTAWVAIGRFKGVEQVWRGGVFDTPEEAQAEFEENVAFGTFVRTQAIKLR